MSGLRAPEAPGTIGQQIEPMAAGRYLNDLMGWVDARKAELDSLDHAVQASRYSEELTRDIALNLQIWHAIQARVTRFRQIWDGGRVGAREREQLSNAIWSRMDNDDQATAQLSGLSLPEACKLSDALTSQLRTRLQLDPSGAEVLGKVRSLQAGLERIRDQIALEPAQLRPQANAVLDGLNDRLAAIEEKISRGGDVGGLIGPLEMDAARFERDLIITAATRRAQPNTPPAPDATDQLYQRLTKREAELRELVDQVVASVEQPPKYAVPSLAALGEPPVTGPEREAFASRLALIDQAMDQVEQAYRAALGAPSAVGELQRLAERIDQANSGDQAAEVKQLVALSLVIATRSQTPEEVVDHLLSACRQLVDDAARKVPDEM